MAIAGRIIGVIGGLALVCCVTLTARADVESASPLGMVRSLQYVQDAIAKGDHSAIEMQRHLLTLIDDRLRGADPSIFADPANVDAALIYAMSGGNPETLGVLAGRAEGDGFDPRLVEVIETYLIGRGQTVLDDLLAILPEYRDTRIEAYLTLITANSAVDSEPETALDLYDRARLLLPGTIVEEAALRRSISLCEDIGRVEEGIVHAARYARRFLHSPYAAQFADLFVALVIAHPETVGADRITKILAFMDADRRRSVYLRIARQAAIGGNQALALKAAEAARAPGGNHDKIEALASLYAGAAGVPSGDVLKAASRIEALDAADLSPRDQALRQAAGRIAEAVVSPPDPRLLSAAPPGGEALPTLEAAPSIAVSAGDGAAADPLEDFVKAKRAVLDTVDQLLEDDR